MTESPTLKWFCGVETDRVGSTKEVLGKSIVTQWDVESDLEGPNLFKHQKEQAKTEEISIVNKGFRYFPHFILHKKAIEDCERGKLLGKVDDDLNGKQGNRFISHPLLCAYKY